MERDTVFVRGLAPGTHHDELNEAFSEIGPVKSAFVVVEKDGPNKGKSRGFGFVQFALTEDATEAVKELQNKQLGDGKLRLELAEKKGYKRGNGNGSVKESGLRGPKRSSPSEKQGVDRVRDDEELDQTKWSAAKRFFHELARNAVVRSSSDGGSSDDSDSSGDNSDSNSDDSNSDSDSDSDSDSNGCNSAIEKEDSASGKPPKTLTKKKSAIARTEEILRECSVVVYNLPEGMNESGVRKKAAKIGKVNAIQIPFESDESCEYEERSALIVYTKRTSAVSAASKLSDKEWSSFTLSGNNKRGKKKKNEEQLPKPATSTVLCRRILQIACSKRAKERCRLIVRNLAFNATAASLRSAFSPFGPVLSVEIATTEQDGKSKSRGFAFIQFACRVDASAALAKLNGSKIGPRPVAVDWALNKKEYERALERSKNGTAATAPGDDQGADDDAQASLDSASTSGDRNESDGDDDDDNQQVAEEEMGGGGGKEQGRGHVNSRGGETSSVHGSEIELNTTLFVRNILFETTEDELYDTFKRFGPVRYVKIAKGPDGRSRGTGFVNFYRRKGFENALKDAATVPQAPPRGTSKSAPNAARNEPGGQGIQCAGRPLLVTPALDRSGAKSMEKERGAKRAREDKRHLYLLREGLIHAESDVVVPKNDLAKRENADKEKKTKLKNPIFFVSPLRLSVRNLFKGVRDGTGPEAVTEAQVKKAFLDAAIKGIREGLVNSLSGDESLYPPGWPDKSKLPSPQVLKVRLIRDAATSGDAPAPGEADASRGKAASKKASYKAIREARKAAEKHGKSKGYGFVEFSQHVHALAALRVLNNNPEYSHLAAGGPSSKKVPAAQRSRLIVEFAVENAAKVRLQNLRADKLKAKSGLAQPGSKDKAGITQASPPGKGPSSARAPNKAGRGKRKLERNQGAADRSNKRPKLDELPAKDINKDLGQAKKQKKRKKISSAVQAGQKQDLQTKKPSTEEYRNMVNSFKKQMLKEVTGVTDDSAENRKRWFE